MLDNNQAEDVLNLEDFKRIVENLLFITDRPLSVAKISQTAEINNIELTRAVVAALQKDYTDTARAIQVIEIGGGYQMATKPEYGRWVRRLFNEKLSSKLSNAALETLAIIAYKQPVTRAEIENIRGVDIVAPLEKIMERGLAKVVGKKDAPGRPMVYGTTDEFLRLFGLNKLGELPELKTFAAKGPRQLQGDLPFTEMLPDIKESILPLDETQNLDDLEIAPGIFKPLAKVQDDIVIDQSGAQTALPQDIKQNTLPQTEDTASSTLDAAMLNDDAANGTVQHALPDGILQPDTLKHQPQELQEELASPYPQDADLPEDMQLDDIKI